MSSAVTARPQCLESETIGTPSPTIEVGSAQESGSVQDTIETLGARPNPRGDKTRGRNIRLLAIVLTLVTLVITGTGGMLLLHTPPPQTHSYPGYLSGNGTLAFFDPLSREGIWHSKLGDASSSCRFTGGAYHVGQLHYKSGFGWCYADGIFGNFAFEVHLTITQGDCGGITFRNDGRGHFYNFTICQNGKYIVSKYTSDIGAASRILTYSPSSTIHTGLGKPNKIAVVASNSMLLFYINEQRIDQQQDSSYTSGRITLIAYSLSADDSHPADVAYSNVTLWTL